MGQCTCAISAGGFCIGTAPLFIGGALAAAIAGYPDLASTFIEVWIAGTAGAGVFGAAIPGP